MRHSNIAMEEQVTVVEYIAVARDILAAQGVAAATAEEAAAAVEELGAEVCNYQNQSSIDIEKAKRVLGWEPTPFADAMRSGVRPLLLALFTSAPASNILRMSEGPWTPLSATRSASLGIAGMSLSAVARSMAKLRRSRLFTPMIAAPAATALSSSGSS